MSSVKPKRRRKIPYIGKRLTASEIAAAYPLPPKYQAIADKVIAEIRAERVVGSRRRKSTSSAKTARAK